MQLFAAQPPSARPACERKLTAELVAHSARSERAAALAWAEGRAAARLKNLQFIDTRPALIRSEAFAEDLFEPAVAPIAAAAMRGLAGVASLHLAGMMAAGTALSAWMP